MENSKQEELDLLWVLKSIQKVISKFLGSIKWLIDFSLKKFWYLLLFALVGACLGFGLNSYITPYYTTEMIVSHTRMENDYCGILINSLNSQIVSGTSNLGLSKLIGLNPEYTKSIKSFTFVPLKRELTGQKDKYDSLKLFLPFAIQVQVYDNSILDSLQKSLLGYLESNSYASERKQLEFDIMQRYEAKLVAENLEVDSLKRIVNQGIIPRGSGNGIILGEPINPISVYRQSIELYEKQLQVRYKRLLNNSFSVVVDFLKNPIPSNSYFLQYVLIGFLIGYAVGMIYLLRRNHNRQNN